MEVGESQALCSSHPEQLKRQGGRSWPGVMVSSLRIMALRVAGGRWPVCAGGDIQGGQLPPKAKWRQALVCRLH